MSLTYDDGAGSYPTPCNFGFYWLILTILVLNDRSEPNLEDPQLFFGFDKNWRHSGHWSTPMKSNDPNLGKTKYST